MGNQSEGAPVAPTGELLRAMRCRRGLTLEQVAAALGVQPSTICRWERGESTPLLERREALFDLLGALPQERAALANGHWIFPEHGVGATAWDEIEAELAALRARISQGERALMDLQLLALEARLWRLARVSPAARPLLIQLWSDYAARLSWDDRRAEAARYADRVLWRVREDPGTGRSQMSAVLRALQVAALVLGRRPAPGASVRAVELLQEWLLLTNEPEWHASVYRDMAEHAALGGRPEAALAFSEQALRAAAACDSAEPRRLCRHVHAEALLRAGRPREAYLFLAADSDAYPFRLILESLQRAAVLLALQERAEANDALNRAYDLIEAYHYPNFRQTADALAAQF